MLITHTFENQLSGFTMRAYAVGPGGATLSNATTNPVTRFVQMGPGAFALRTSAGEVVLLNDPRLGL